jgi:hypothetical protein
MNSNDTVGIEPGDAAAKIRALNDALRQGHVEQGMILVTSGISAMGEAFVAEVMRSVASFEAFDSDNDPHREHDFGVITVQDEKIFWKVDYYDLAMEAHSPDPANSAVTKRVLTIMLSSEY